MAGQVDPDGVCFICGITFPEALKRDHAADWKVHSPDVFSGVVTAETCSTSCARTYCETSPVT